MVVRPFQYSDLHVLRMELVSLGVFNEISAAAAAVSLFGAEDASVVVFLLVFLCCCCSAVVWVSVPIEFPSVFLFLAGSKLFPGLCFVAVFLSCAVLAFPVVFGCFGPLLVSAFRVVSDLLVNRFSCAVLLQGPHQISLRKEILFRQS